MLKTLRPFYRVRTRVYAGRVTGPQHVRIEWDK